MRSAGSRSASASRSLCLDVYKRQAVARSERIADRDRQAMAERASGNLDLRALLAVGVHAELVGIQAFKVLYHVVLRIGCLLYTSREVFCYLLEAKGYSEKELCKKCNLAIACYALYRHRIQYNGI